MTQPVRLAALSCESMETVSDPNVRRAKQAKALVLAKRFGVLATVSKQVPGYPFGSVVAYAIDEQGRPLLLLSRLAVHTKNLTEDARASLVVFERDPAADPLSSARVTLIGDILAVPEHELAGARRVYVERHPAAAQYVAFGDFDLYRLEIRRVYFVGGFGEMGWVQL